MKILFEDLAVQLDGQQIASGINFQIWGICNLLVASPDSELRHVLMLFEKNYTEEHHHVTFSGRVSVDGKSIPVDRFFLLLNQHRLFDCNETVMDALCLIDEKRAKQVMDELEVDIGGSFLDRLNIEESRIFELVLSIVSMPPFIFLNSIELHKKTRRHCLNLLRKYTDAANTACLILADHDSFFDGTVVIQKRNIISLDRKAGDKYRVDAFLGQFSADDADERTDDESSAPSAEEAAPAPGDPAARNKAPAVIPRNSAGPAGDFPGASEETVKGARRPWKDRAAEKNAGEYDYRTLYKKYKCENLLDLHFHSPPQRPTPLTYDIYRINISQAFRLAFRKYFLMIERYQHRLNIYKNIGPFMVTVFLVRFFQAISFAAISESLPVLAYYFLALLTGIERARYPALVFVLYAFMLEHFTLAQLLSGIYNLFRHGYSYREFCFISAFLYLCIFYSNSAMFDEDYPFIAFYVNIVMTPGTYVLSAFIYLFCTQLIAFYAVGKIFNINCIFITLLNAIAMNLLFAACHGRRLREGFIGHFLSVYLFVPLGKFTNHHDYTYKVITCCVFPSIICKRFYFSTSRYFPWLFAVILYYIVIYLFVCYSISRSTCRLS